MLNFLAQLAVELDPEALVDKAANASDRWLALAAFAIILLGGICIIRYLIKDQEKQRTEHSASQEKMRTEHNAFVTSLYTETLKLTATVLAVLQEVNPALRRVADQLDRLEK